MDTETLTVMHASGHSFCSAQSLASFQSSALDVNPMLQAVAESKESIDIEACFSQLTLDVIGKAVFNYDFNALNTDSPLIQVLLPADCLLLVSFDASLVCTAYQGSHAKPAACLSSVAPF